MDQKVLAKLTQLSEIYQRISNGEMSTEHANKTIELLEHLIYETTLELCEQKDDI